VPDAEVRLIELPEGVELVATPRRSD
jgi:hypothetical protein